MKKILICVGTRPNFILDTVRHYAECGVDYVSVGALTHSVHNMDLSLKAI